MAKRKVFISYHHLGEQFVVDSFVARFSDAYDVFTDRSIERAAESDNVDYLNQVCRDAINGTSVTILFVGRRTGYRKFVDWELRHTLYLQHGLVAISRPGLLHNDARLPERLIDNIRTGYAKWYDYPASAIELAAVIDEAYFSDKRNIDNTRPKMVRNTG